jgi:hypothetical protein
MKKLSVITIFFLCLFTCVLPALAIPWNYNYIGGTFNIIEDATPPAGSYSFTDRVTISLTTYDDMLPDGPSIDLPTYISSWAFSDGRQVLTETNSYISGSWMTISGGAITAWQVWAWSTVDNAWIEATNFSGVRFENGIIYDDEYVNCDVGKFNPTTTLGPGWNASPVPEPAIMLLLGFSIIGLAGFRRKLT